ncbi:MAG: TolC family protein [Alphaproteobacteria bacterium]|nr:TolC family protein [Alphaproteobacteria bacterium]
MKKYKLFFSIMLSLLIINKASYAEEKKDVYTVKAPLGCLDKNIAINKEVSLIDLIKIGICNNPELNADYMGLKESEANLGAAKSEYYPNITLGSGISKNTIKNQGRHHTENDPYNVNLGLSLLLYDFGGRSARIDSFRYYLANAGFSYNRALQNLILTIHTDYFKLLGAKEDLKSARANEAMYKKSFDEASRKYEVGLAALNDKLQTQTSYEQSKLKVIEMENAVKQYQGDLAITLNLPPQTTFKLKQPPKDRDLTALDKKDTLDKMIDAAARDRDEIRAQEMILNAANSSLRELKASRYGSFSLAAESGYNNTWKSPHAYNRDNSIGVNYKVPLFTGFNTSYKISAAKYKREQERYNLDAIRNNIKNEVWSAYHNYQTAMKSYDVSKKVLKSAEENERVAFRSYEVGSTDIINLLTAETQLAEARDAVINAFYTVLIDKATLYRAIGRF